MRVSGFSAWARFFRVLFLFLSIFWAFYSLKFKRIWHRRNWHEARKEKLYISEAERFRKTAVKMGGLLIKLGQFFSTRVDMLPQSSIDILTGLQDEVPGVAFAEIKKVAEEEFSCPIEEVFAWVEESSLASASLGQVHRGELPGGQIVAIKILRPGIEELIAIDLRALRQVLNWTMSFTNWESFIDLEAIYQEFEETVLEELDYIREAHNAETIAKNSQDDPELLVPGIFWDYTRRRILTMEFKEGIKINNLVALDQAGVDRQAIARKLLEIYVEQVLVDGFFHADPHPGNLFVTSDGRILMVDYGMVGTVTVELRDQLLEMVFALVKRDYPSVVAYLKEIGFLRFDADNETVTRAVGLFIEHVLGRRKDMSRLDLSSFLEDLEVLLYEQPFQIPANFTFLGRALGTLYGICIALDPQIDFLEVSKPYVDQLAPAKEIWSLAKEKTTNLFTSLLEIPPLLEKVLLQTERGEIKFKLPLRNLNEKIQENTRAQKMQAWAIVFGFSLISSIYLLVNDFVVLSRYGFVFTALSFLLLLYLSRPPKVWKPPHPPLGNQRRKKKNKKS
ncbi:MAG: AarF/UbiB family protein [Syntrophomonas sp.]|uniref:ABC1 kinase family protein n=1 Tax=Syntrophomonas sp. TaxID=2053627 RepID=UPI00261A03AF|nr:AarF/UbiB family protein [Syntrophomonas sp.]MDD2510311.1 AarF/UbiB family protein [Syntrophomonas sp.]MDD4626320.1 AarF/UbiB family protein [Syntrophomonas sp.]